MTEMKILLRDDRRHFRPGDVVEGVAGWRAERVPASVELRLFWYTRGKGTEDVGLVGRLPFPSPQPSEGRPFQFALPDEPYSFSGELISVVWALELVLQPGDQAVRVELIVSPSGQEILLHPHASTR